MSDFGIWRLRCLTVVVDGLGQFSCQTPADKVCGENLGLQPARLTLDLLFNEVYHNFYHAQLDTS